MGGDRNTGIFELPLALRDRRVGLFYDYWRRKCPPGGLPSRRALDPAEMTQFLPCVTLLDVEQAGARRRFRVRLMGTHLVDLFGEDVTGQYLDETSASGGRDREILSRLEAIIETGRPAYGVAPVSRPNRDYIQYEHLTLPLASDGRAIDMLFGIRCGLQDSATGTGLV